MSLASGGHPKPRAAQRAYQRYDILWDPEKVSGDELGLRIAQCLCKSGVCTIHTNVLDDALEQALVEVGDLDAKGLFRRPPWLLLQGLLDENGSARIARLNSKLEDQAELDGKCLASIDAQLSHISDLVAPFSPMLGCEISARGRTDGLLHEAGEPEGDEFELPDGEAMEWLDLFKSQQFMVLFFLGPSPGTLLMEPFDDDDLESNEFPVESYKVPVEPGTYVILRADKLSHLFYSHGPSYTMSCWLPQHCNGPARRQKTFALVPHAKMLEEYMNERLGVLREQKHSPYAEPLPRNMELYMRRLSPCGSSILASAIRSLELRLPQCLDSANFWCALTTGADCAVTIPATRYDTTWDVFDPEPSRGKAYCYHAAFISNVELFDPKFFGLSNSQVVQASPQKRHFLEVGYTAMFMAGWNRKRLMRSLTGVYLGFGSREVGNDIDPNYQPVGNVAFGDDDGAMTAGQLSYTFGMTGPTMAIDCESSSSTVALCTLVNALHMKPLASVDQALFASPYLHLSARSTYLECRRGLLSVIGRCQSFDENADGFIKGDSVLGGFVTPCSVNVDNQPVETDDLPSLGTLVGAVTMQSGRTTTLGVPDAIAQQDLFRRVIAQSGLSPLDIDTVDCFAAGRTLCDGLEAVATARALRGLEQDGVLQLGAVKSGFAHGIEASGMVQILKVLMSAAYGVCPASLHMKAVCPHVDFDELPVVIPSESLEFKLDYSFSSVSSHGRSGTFANCAFYRVIDERRVAPSRPGFEGHDLLFWPGGGGALESGAIPKRLYTIVGSWSSWKVAHEMQDEGDGAYGYTVTLGENCFERFQIWLDGDPSRTLHPGQLKAPQNAPVCGPEDRVGFLFNWQINGRSFVADQSNMALEDTTRSVLSPSAIGDQYRIRLRVAGRFRTVDWERLEDRAGIAAKSSVASGNGTSGGTYFVVGTWNCWTFEEMDTDEATPGMFHADVRMLRNSEEFQIVRNRDWNQVFYPSFGSKDMTDGSPNQVLGPDFVPGGGWNWEINGRPGDICRVEFRRLREAGFDQRTVSWHRTGRVLLGTADKEMVRYPRFFAIGSWDSWYEHLEMLWDGTEYRLRLRLGSTGKESFQILAEGNRTQIIHPSVEHATPDISHELCGPHDWGHDLCWTIGVGAEYKPGTEVEVRLLVASSEDEWCRHPCEVRWNLSAPSSH